MDIEILGYLYITNVLPLKSALQYACALGYSPSDAFDLLVLAKHPCQSWELQ